MRYVTYPAPPKSVALDQLRAILARLETLDPHAKVAFDLKVRWMEPGETQTTSVTWSNRRR
jgi:hypothetical protein